MDNKTPISAAQDILFEHPFDAYHDIFHHYKVWENTRKISFFENLSPNFAVLDIACWWHDVFKGEDNNSLLLESLKKTSISSEILQEVVAIIDEHSFGKQQTHLESKILYDADKIEYISVQRWQKSFDAFARGEISEEEKNRYVNAWNERVPSLIGKMYFSYSNEQYKQNYDLFTQWLASIGRYKDGRFV